MTTTNTTQSEGGAQYYGDANLPGVVNTTLHSIFGGIHDIEPFLNTGEGVWSGNLPDGTSGYMTSRNIIKTLDILAEGEIEGIVSGEFVPYDDDAAAGQIGWRDRRYHSIAARHRVEQPLNIQV